jgi:predicted nucleic acid-binding protein
MSGHARGAQSAQVAARAGDRPREARRPTGRALLKASVLIDTGAILALLDRDDDWHERCATTFRSLRLPLATSAAVLAELFHILEPHEHAAAWRLLRSGAVVVLPVGDEDLADIEQLMQKYRDRPMDFADATLVRLARRERTKTVFTVDDDFLVYRIDGRQRFLVLPER